jgi:murein tripeptide amidase MpaA
MLEGFINFLCEQSPLAIEILSRFTFKIIPVMNPDGVVCGNYRCNFAGYDLNRWWHKANAVGTESIF